MNRLLLSVSIIMCIIIQDVKAQNNILRTSNDTSFVNFLKRYVKQNYVSGDTKGIPALFVLNQSTNDCQIGITMLSVLSEFNERIPSGYTYINNILVLLYDGSQHVFLNDSSSINKLRVLVKKDLCDDTAPLPNITGAKGEVAIHSSCYFKFDPSEWLLTFRDGLLISKELLKVPLLDSMKK